MVYSEPIRQFITTQFISKAYYANIAHRWAGVKGSEDSFNAPPWARQETALACLQRPWRRFSGTEERGERWLRP